jgi:predicted nucleic acid-binding protein
VNFLLDTNVVSELAKPAANPGVARFLAETDENSIFLAVITLAELQYGIERMPAGLKRERLKNWLEGDLVARFDGRIFAMDILAATEWGRIMARGEKLGRPMSEMDAWIAAVAAVRDLVLVTRNTPDFAGYNGKLFNPWT